MIAYDCHIHSDFSTDSATPMEEQVKKAISLGLAGICMTDHMDYDFPKEQLDSSILCAGNPFEFNWSDYKKAIRQIQAEHPCFQLLSGVECGLQTTDYVIEKNQKLSGDHDLDYLLGSLHLVDRKDPYYPSFWEGQDPSLCIRHYFEQLYHNLLCFSEMDALGHLDYIVRYAPESFSYSPMEYRDILEELFAFIIRRDIALEINSSGFKTTSQPNPHRDILALYKEMGGQAVTIGSDAHNPSFICYSFDKIAMLLKETGFSEYYTFEKRMPVSHLL